MRKDATPTLLVDAHVHLRPCFRVSSLLEAVAANLHPLAQEIALSEDPIGILILAHDEGDQTLDQIQSESASRDLLGWELVPTREQQSLLAVSRSGIKLMLLEGAQLETAEHLEVIALGTTTKPDGGLSLAATLEVIRESGGVAIVPWGFGKWSFGRGRTLAQVLETQQPTDVFLGDSGGRPRVWSTPSLITKADRIGFRVLSGSDPLPFDGEHRRVGRFGSVLQSHLSSTSPLRDLVRSLKNLDLRTRPFGAGVSLQRFATNQVKLIWRRRIRRENDSRNPR